jgi:mono/diheme cytochrome c family protein
MDNNQNELPHLGLLAEYETPEALMAASEKVRDGGYKRWDTHTPFPVHGIDDAMGIKPTILPWIVLGAGATGTMTALLLQWWTNAVAYPFLISGKPLFSWVPSFPVTFELTVLFAGVTTLFAMLGLNRLPRLHNPLFEVKRFARATQDRFFLAIDSADPLFNDRSARALLESTGANAIDEVPNKGASLVPPIWLLQVGIMLAFASFVPLGLIYSSWESTSDKPAWHFVWDMDFQESYRAGEKVPLFENGMAMRAPVEGTIASGELFADSSFHRGVLDDASLAIPAVDRDASVYVVESPMPATMALMERGRERFAIYCIPCHGASGNGNGIVQQRAQKLIPLDMVSNWVTPTDVTTETVASQPDGQLFDSITNGIRNMPAYGPQITVEDRWAIVLFVRALQRAANATIDDVPAANRGGL